MGVCQSNRNNDEMTNEEGIATYQESNQVQLIKKEQEEADEVIYIENDNNPHTSFLKLKSAAPMISCSNCGVSKAYKEYNNDNEKKTYYCSQMCQISHLRRNDKPRPKTKTKVKLFFKSYAQNGVIFVNITNYMEIKSHIDIPHYDMQDEYLVQYKLPARAKWDSFTITSQSDVFYNGSFRFRVPVELYQFEIKLKIKCDIQELRYSAKNEQYFVRNHDYWISRTVKLKVKPYSYTMYKSLKEIRLNDMVRIRKEMKERMNECIKRNHLNRFKSKEIVFETFSIGSALKSMVGKIDHHTIKGDIIKGINTGLKRIFRSKSERYFIGFKIFQYLDISDYNYHIQCISSKNQHQIILTYAWREYLRLGPKLYCHDKDEYKYGYHPESLLFDTCTDESIFICHICQTRVKWFEHIFVCGCNKDHYNDNFGAHRYCILCLYIICLQYKKLSECLMDILDKDGFNNYLIDDIVSFCLGQCKVKQFKI